MTWTFAWRQLCGLLWQCSWYHIPFKMGFSHDHHSSALHTHHIWPTTTLSSSPRWSSSWQFTILTLWISYNMSCKRYQTSLKNEKLLGCIYTVVEVLGAVLYKWLFQKGMVVKFKSDVFSCIVSKIFHCTSYN